MADFILQATLSNVLISAFLAVVAWIIQKRFQAATVANIIWIMVLLKMVTPPLFSIPLLEVNAIASSELTADVVAPLDATLLSGDGMIREPVNSAGMTLQPAASRWYWLGWNWLGWLGCVWIVVSGGLLSVSLLRVVRFHRLLHRRLQPATEPMEKLTARLAAQFQLKKTPRLAMTRANISPFVWWNGARPLVVVPQLAIEGLEPDELRLVVAHELAHIKRLDYCVRWLEWFTFVALWWNPVLWVTRRQLRTTEEIACDALVIDTVRPKKQQYAHALLNMAELLTTSTIRPPAVASAINSGGILEKRLTMIISEKTMGLTSWMRAAVAVLALVVFPVGLVCAQDYEAVQKRLGEAVRAGELSRVQAGVMLRALKASESEEEAKETDLAAMKEEYQRALESGKAAVESRWATKEQVEERLKVMRQRMLDKDGSSHWDGDDHEMEAKKKRYMEAAEKIEAMVESGKVSKADAKKRLNEMRERMFRSGDGSSARAQGDEQEMEAKKKRYMEAAEKIEAMVESGKVSKADAEKRLNEMRKRMFRSGDGSSAKAKGDEQEMEAKKKRYMEAAEKIEAMVESGKVSKADAEKRLNEMRKRMFRSGDGSSAKAKGDEQEMEAKKKRYMEAAEKIEAMVESGKVSKADAEKRLNEMRKRMFRSGDGSSAKAKGSKGKADREMEGKKLRYRKAAAAITASVEAGKLSKEEAERKLIEMRMKMFGDGDR